MAVKVVEGRYAAAKVYTDVVEEGDLIHLDVRQRILEIVGVKGERKTPEEMEAILAERKKNWQPKPVKYKRGVLRLFSDLAASPMKGAYLEYEKG